MEDRPLRLAGAHEVRDLLGISRQRVYQLAAKADFPRPIAVLAQGKVWVIDDIEEWVAKYRLRNPRRPVRSTDPAESAGVVESAGSVGSAAAAEEAEPSPESLNAGSRGPGSPSRESTRSEAAGPDRDAQLSSSPSASRVARILS
jgi:prophage regulatory protein